LPPAASWPPPPHLNWLIAGRALQGAGAVSAAVTALLADQTRDSVRTKAMALVGASIGLMFALSLVAAPLLAARIGLHGLFAITGALALACIAVVLVDAAGAGGAHPTPARPPRRRAGHGPLLRLDVGVFVLHAVQLAMWVACRRCWWRPGWPRTEPLAGLPAGGAGFLRRDGRHVFPLERRGYLRAVFLGAIGLVLLVQLGLLATGGPSQPAGAAGRPAVPVLLRLQRAGGHPAQPGLAAGAAACARRGAGRVQHAAVAGIFCRRRGRRLAGQERWMGRAVHRLCGADAGLAGGGLAHAGAGARDNHRRPRTCWPAEAQAT
jgi:MFS family permease